MPSFEEHRMQTSHLMIFEDYYSTLDLRSEFAEAITYIEKWALRRR